MAAVATTSESAHGVDPRTVPVVATPGFLAAGNPRPVLERAAAVACPGSHATLALVLESEGSTYSRAGAVALFDGDHQTGWLSGGCLEPELARRAALAASDARLDWIELDTRDDAALFSGSALGCRGRLRVALLPLAAMPGSAALLGAWLEGGICLQFVLERAGRVELRSGGHTDRWCLPVAPVPWEGAAAPWSLSLAPLPELLVLGAGPETPMLLGLLRDLGWRTTVVEPRSRWRDGCGHADTCHDTADALLCRGFAAALVMHHSFERDRDALALLAATQIPVIGLLGPRRRRDDLFKLLTATERAALEGRLHAPVGLDLGGQGPEAIALSIAAQLQQWRARTGQP